MRSLSQRLATRHGFPSWKLANSLVKFIWGWGSLVCSWCRGSLIGSWWWYLFCPWCGVFLWPALAMPAPAQVASAEMTPDEAWAKRLLNYEDSIGVSGVRLDVTSKHQQTCGVTQHPPTVNCTFVHRNGCACFYLIYFRHVPEYTHIDIYIYIHSGSRVDGTNPRCLLYRGPYKPPLGECAIYSQPTLYIYLHKYIYICIAMVWCNHFCIFQSRWHKTFLVSTKHSGK